MKKELITAVKTPLLTVPGIKGVSVWNNQTAKDRDQIKGFPYIFIEFRGLTYKDTSPGVQECNGGKVFCHLLYKSLAEDDNSRADFSQDVYKAMKTAGFSRVNENPDTRHGSISDWIVEFEIPRFEDKDALTTRIISKADLTPEITK